MNMRRKSTFLNRLQKAGYWFLLLAVMVMTLQPLHFHVHHDHDVSFDAHDVSLHEHVVDQHFIGDALGEAHHADALTIEATPDSIVKVSGSMVVAPMLLFIFLLLVWLSPGLSSYLKRLSRRLAFISFTHHFIPPLRAPPR